MLNIDFNHAAPKRAESPENFVSLNGFYKRPDARRIVYDLYKGICQASGQPVSFEDAHVGHIVPQSQPDLFQQLYPGLDIHNLVNLHLLSSRNNLRVSNFIVASPLALHNAISYSARVVAQRLDKVLPATNKSFNTVESAKRAIGKDITYDFSLAYVHAIDGNGYHAIPYKDVRDAIAINSNSHPLANEHIGLGGLFGEYINYKYNRIVSRKYSNQTNGDKPLWAQNLEADSTAGTLDKNLDSSEEWVVLPGNKKDASRTHTVKRFTHAEIKLIDLVRLHDDLNCILACKATNSRFLNDKKSLVGDFNNLLNRMENRFGIKFPSPKFALIEKGTYQYGSLEGIEDKKGHYLYAKDPQFSGYVYERADIKMLQKKCAQELHKACAACDCQPRLALVS